MHDRSANRIIELSENREIIVVGAGKNGIQLAEYLLNKGVNIRSFFDNNRFLYSRTIFGLPVESPRKYEKGNWIYVISTEMPVRDELIEQLICLGIDKDNILVYYPTRSYEYLRSVDENEYQEIITEMFRENIGYDMSWEKPQTYNELINWEKIRINDDNRTWLADKVLVKEWVKDKIGERYLVKNIGVYKSVDEIDDEKLPPKYVLKMNNGSVRNIIVKNKDEIDFYKIKSQLSTWFEKNYAYEFLEMHYKNIVPQILCEEYLEEFENGAVDYKVYCFHGKPKFIQRIKNEHTELAKALFYDTEWNPQEFTHYYPIDDYVDRPVFLDDMLRLTQTLCKDFTHVRVDWFVFPDNTFLFGEMTFSSWAGIQKILPEKYDLLFGQLITNCDD